MISYTLPDFTVGLSRNLLFIHWLKKYPEYFIDGLRIDSVYGCFPSCILNGGRSFIRERYTPEQMEQTLSALEELDVKARFTFTNMLVDTTHLKDPYVVEILEVARKYNTEVIVYSDEIGTTLKERYGFGTILSTTRHLNGVDEFNRMAELYDYVVLDYNRNKDFAFIDKIIQKEKIEIMVNEFCEYRCRNREAHYLHNSKDQLADRMTPFPCSHRDLGKFFQHDPDHPVFLTDRQVDALNKHHGIECFKIVGRGIPLETVLEAYTYFLVKPEYRASIKYQAQQALQSSHTF